MQSGAAALDLAARAGDAVLVLELLAARATVDAKTWVVFCIIDSLNLPVQENICSFSPSSTSPKDVSFAVASSVLVSAIFSLFYSFISSIF